MSNSMINPSVVDLLKKVENRYTLVTITAKRARQLIEGEEPLVRITSTKPVTISINEISQDVVTYTTGRDAIK